MIWNPKRVLWLLPTVLVTTLLSFWLVAGTTSDAATDLPIFFNPQPQSIDRAAWSAAQRAADGEGSAAGELKALGGAALPHILPRFDQFEPLRRGRLAMALLPIAERMRVLPIGFAARPDSAVSFWLSYWEEHFVNFREVSVRRSVARYLARATPAREQELLNLDTFAVEELIQQLSAGLKKPRSPAELVRSVTLISEVLSHVSDLDWRAEPLAKPADAHALGRRWQHWWAERRFRFTAPRGVERFVAPLLQTRYAAWARETAQRRPWFGGDALAGLGLRNSLLLSLSLLLCGWLGFALGPALADELSKRVAATRRGLLQAPLFVFLPAATAATGLTPLPSSWLLSAFLVGGLGLLLGYQQRLISPALQQSVRSALYLADEPGSKAQPAWRKWLERARAAPAARTASGNAVNLVPNTVRLLTGITFIESATRLDGVCWRTLQSVQQRDVTWVMLATISLSSLLGLLQLLSDRWLRRETNPYAAHNF